MNDEQIARMAYRAYGDTVEWKNYQGLPMPEWDALPQPIRTAWTAACAAVVRFVVDQIETALKGIQGGAT
jgi:hypothetical protein